MLTGHTAGNRQPSALIAKPGSSPVLACCQLICLPEPSSPPVLQLLNAIGMSSARGRDAIVLMCLPSRSHSCVAVTGQQDISSVTAQHSTLELHHLLRVNKVKVKNSSMDEAPQPQQLLPHLQLHREAACGH
jgi:hypothetical protein